MCIKMGEMDGATHHPFNLSTPVIGVNTLLY